MHSWMLECESVGAQLSQCTSYIVLPAIKLLGSILV